MNVLNKSDIRDFQCLRKFILNWQVEIHSSHIDSLVRLIPKFKLPLRVL